MPKIKLCGMFRDCDIDYANAAKPDYVGFILSPGYRRSVSASWAAEMRKKLDGDIETVGVFVDEPCENVAEIYKAHTIDMIQLHGNEDEAYIRALKELAPGAPISKAVRVQSPGDVLAADSLPVDYLLLDTYRAGVAGGTGESFDWSMIPDVTKPIFLAGGINTENIDDAAGLDIYAIDTSSGIESDGVKDPEKMMYMVEHVRRHAKTVCAQDKED